MYNKKLAEQRNLSQQIQNKIQIAQNNRELLKLEMGRAISDPVESRRQLLEMFKANEKSLQALWGFEDNAFYRRMEELKIPGCNCPYLDNKDARGLRVYVNETCPWHN